MQDISITPQFTNFVYTLLRFRCNLKESTVTRFFIENKESMTLFRQAFIHSSFDPETNYELLEFEGDGVIGSAVVQYIRRKYPDVVSVRFNTRLKHTLVSGKVLARMAIANGFEEFLVISADFQVYIESFPNKWDCEAYGAAYEDTVEATCGVIMSVLNKYTAQGVGDAACYNFISSLLDEYDISLKYEDLFDAKSRLKEIFDAQGWNSVQACSLSKCLVTYELDDVSIEKYKREMGNRAEKSIIESNNAYITFGYACISPGSTKRTLLVVTTANTKQSEQDAAEFIITRLNRMGISIPIPDAYERKPKKSKKYVIPDKNKLRKS